MNQSPLALKFLEETGDQELWTPIYNSAPLVQTSGFHLKKYFSQFYQDTLPFPAFVSMVAGEGILYIPITKTKSMAEEFCEKALENPSIINQLEAERASKHEEFRSHYKKLNAAFFDNQDLEESYRELKEFLNELWSFNAKFFFSLGFDKEVCDKVFQKHDVLVSDEKWDTISRAPIISLDKRHAHEIARAVQEGLSRDALAERFQYVFASYGYVPSLQEMPPLLKRDFSDYLDLEKNKELVLKDEEDYEREAKKFLSFLNSLTPLEQEVARIIQYVMELRDLRKDVILMASTICFRAARSALKKVGLPIELAPYVLVEELQSLEALQKSAGDIERRRLGFDVYLTYEGATEVQYGATRENRELIERQYHLQNPHDTSLPGTVTGTIACRGVVKGRVRIVRTITLDSEHFKQGDVLVTGMTRPEYLFLMKKASAIVTDEGGLTCHAAIVSRELGIPCIISTKIATKVFKDGDMVEVDADNGIVRKL